MKATLFSFILILGLAANAGAQTPAKPCARCQEMSDITASGSVDRDETFMLNFTLSSDPEVAKMEALPFTLMALKFVPLDQIEYTSSSYYYSYNQHKALMEATLRSLKPSEQKILRDSLRDSTRLFQSGGNHD